MPQYWLNWSLWVLFAALIQRGSSKYLFEFLANKRTTDLKWITDKFRYADRDFKQLEEMIVDDMINSKHHYKAFDCQVLAKIFDPDRGKFMYETCMKLKFSRSYSLNIYTIQWKNQWLWKGFEKNILTILACLNLPIFILDKKYFLYHYNSKRYLDDLV